MTIQEYMNYNDISDIDTYDTDYDAVVTVCRISDAEFDKEIKDGDNYYRFCKFIYNNVEVSHGVQGSDEAVCKWTEFINKYKEVFKSFAKEYWRIGCPSEQHDFEYKWINEIHSYLAGNISDKMYGELTDDLEKAKEYIEFERNKKERLHEDAFTLINAYIDNRCEIEGARSVLMDLIELGGTEDVLIELNFDPNEVRDLINTIDKDITDI